MKISSEIISQDLQMILERTEDLWEDLRDGRIFVTGGTGFFGRWLLESFAYANRALGLNAEAVVLTRNFKKFLSSAPHLGNTSGIHFHHGDISNFDLPSGQFTHMIHAASELSIEKPKDPVGTIEAALTGTQRVLKLAANSGVKKFLLTSSGAVYGPMYQGKTNVFESDQITPLPLNSKSAYAQSKQVAELCACIIGQEHGIEIKIARGFAFIGPFLSLDSHLAAAGFLRSALAGKTIKLTGHGKTVRSYLYGADLAVWLWTILFNGSAGQAYNLGSDVSVTIEELAKVIASQSAHKIGVEVKEMSEREGLVDIYVPDLTKAKRELGLEVYTPLLDSISRSYSFFSDIKS